MATNTTAGRTIARLAREGGVGVETVRYYQRRGLLRTPDKSGGSALSGGTRRYGEDDVRRLRFIRQAQAAGFTLEQIGELLDLDAGQDRARARALVTGGNWPAGLADRGVGRADLAVERLRIGGAPA